MSRTQIRSLTIAGKLKGVKVGDEDVCQAFTVGTNELKLIGTGNGVTQLVVWAETGSGDKTLMRAFEVHVEDTVAVTGEAVEQRTAMLNRSIDKMFPGCNVQVTRQGDHLLVRGSCDSDESATKIIRIVRKTCLVPVRDELEIR
jgi:Flp pilus assembly secretin CpaC